MVTNKPKITRPVHANMGVAALYRRRMAALIDAMHESVVACLSSAYSAPVIATDARPTLKAVQKQLRALGKRWIKRFNDSAPTIAEAYVRDTFKSTDSAMRIALREAGWSVKFEMTPAMREMYEATLTENIGLIRSIPQEYLQQVEGIAMRSYTAGRDLEQMVKALKALYPKAANRASLIARDQSNKANGVVIRTRRLELGIVDAVWMHSHAGKVPRPDHVAANRRPFKVAEGCLISGEYIQPGELINCRCTSRSVMPF
jgi:uncharacterized protein with gpF-like domain